MIPMILLFDDDYDWLHFLCLQVSLLLCSKQFYCCQNSIVPHTTTNPGGQECAKNICTLLCAMFPILYFIHESRFEILLLVPRPKGFLVNTSMLSDSTCSYADTETFQIVASSIHGDHGETPSHVQNTADVTGHSSGKGDAEDSTFALRQLH